VPLCRPEHSDNTDNDVEDAHSSLLTHFPSARAGPCWLGTGEHKLEQISVRPDECARDQKYHADLYGNRIPLLVRTLLFGEGLDDIHSANAHSFGGRKAEY